MEGITELTGKQMVEQYGNRRIIDTWTQVIKWSSDQAQLWTGNFRNSKLPSSVLVWWRVKSLRITLYWRYNEPFVM